ncbi:AAA family ATPase [Actimicrobium sp. CCI2.3]|uniref:AAA family ATPase n=1 Tax=Actimicrobium sp. CCI2.3 TaxID=3048616 RepID=UPI002AB381F4|nr:AAA family ATPase [Actimicrobium sp. CCI2.3]MDY7576547.1 AAA family ATPase [Actimicrobium sp. CCI2.3]MEB0023791.1 AAA family ATPase [Actimicrobium sp. CCI2.3]
MLVRIGGANSGIAQYLQTGQKAGRENTRDQLDERLILEGDLSTTDEIINRIDSEGERYKHITLSFKEYQVSPEILQEITDDFKATFLSAYGENEINMYAEAHIPKMRSYIDSDGTVIERFPHIHIVIPTVNLQIDKRASPLELISLKYGSETSTLDMIDAWQETINQKYGLASPKDNLRSDFGSEAEILSRSKGDDFHKKDSQVRQSILNKMIDQKIETRADFEKMLGTFGEVSIGRAGKSDQYFEIRLPSAEGEPQNKKIRLKDAQFTDAYITTTTDVKRMALIQGRNSASQDPIRQAELVESFKTKRAREIKYLHTDSKFFKETYKNASHDEQLRFLDEREQTHYAQLSQKFGYDRQTGEQNEALVIADFHATLSPEAKQKLTDREADFEPADGYDSARITSERLNRSFLRTVEELKLAEIEGVRCITEPNTVVDALTANQSSFTQQDLERYLAKNTADDAQFDEALKSVLMSDALVTKVDSEGKRFSSHAVVEIERDMTVRIDRMMKNECPGIDANDVQKTIQNTSFNSGQATAFQALCSSNAIEVVNGAAGTGKSFVLSKMRETGERSDLEFYGACLQGKTADDLERDSGIKSQTIHGLLAKLDNTKREIKEGESAYDYGKRHVDGSSIRLTSKSVIVIDEAGMVGSRQMAALLKHAEEAGARVRLVGDSRQIAAVEYGSAFKEISERVGVSSLTEIMRQKNDAMSDGGAWMREASEKFAVHDMAAGIEAYSSRGFVKQSETQADAKAAVVDRWKELKSESESHSLIVLCATNAERKSLNEMMRAELIFQGKLSGGLPVQTPTGSLVMAPGEAVMFTRNDREMNVKNGTTGVVQSINESGFMQVKVNGGSVVTVRTDDANIDYGYAVTTHKSQGMTVDKCLVLASPGMRAENAYVAMTRHKSEVELYYSTENFKDEKALITSMQRSEEKMFTGNDQWSETRTNDSMISRYMSEHGAAKVIEKAAKEARFSEINSGLEAKRVLDYVSKSHGIDPARYTVTQAKDGSDRIKCGTRNLSVSDFLTKEMSLRYKDEAAPILKDCYAEQLKGIYSTPRFEPGNRMLNEELFSKFKDWNKEQSTEYKSKIITLDAEKIAERNELVRKFDVNKSELPSSLTPGQQRKEVAKLKRKHVADLKIASAKYKDAKRQIQGVYKKPSSERYKDFIQIEAAKGSLDAIKEKNHITLSVVDVAKVDSSLRMNTDKVLSKQSLILAPKPDFKKVEDDSMRLAESSQERFNAAKKLKENKIEEEKIARGGSFMEKIKAEKAEKAEKEMAVAATQAAEKARLEADKIAQAQTQAKAEAQAKTQKIVVQQKPIQQKPDSAEKIARDIQLDRVMAHRAEKAEKEKLQQQQNSTRLKM